MIWFLDLENDVLEPKTIRLSVIIQVVYKNNFKFPLAATEGRIRLYLCRECLINVNVFKEKKKPFMDDKITTSKFSLNFF